MRVFLLFFAVWMLLNGRIAWDTILSGVLISAVLFVFACLFLRYSVKRDLELCRKAGKLLKLGGILLVEIVRSNLAVLPYIYSGRKKPRPIVARFTPRLTTDTGRVLLANCITMTPGTVTGSLKNGEYLVHCLDESMAEGLDSSVFVDAISEWEEA